MSKVIVARSFSGVCDLYHRVPNLDGYTVTKTECIEENTDDCEVRLHLCKNEGEFILILRQDRL